MDKYTKEEIKALETYYSVKDSNYVSFLINDTLNSMEAICMYFNYGVADESVVYQSLHQSFLATVKLLYVTIAERNLQGKDKYFTNIIQMYNRWNERYESKCKEEIEFLRNTPITPDKIKKQA